MSYSVVVTYKTPDGAVSQVGTNSTRVDAVTSSLTSKGYTILKIKAEGAGKNVTSVTSGTREGTGTVLYKAPVQQTTVNEPTATSVIQTTQPTTTTTTAPKISIQSFQTGIASTFQKLGMDIPVVIQKRLGSYTPISQSSAIGYTTKYYDEQLSNIAKQKSSIDPNLQYTMSGGSTPMTGKDVLQYYESIESNLRQQREQSITGLKSYPSGSKFTPTKGGFNVAIPTTTTTVTETPEQAQQRYADEIKTQSSDMYKQLGTQEFGGVKQGALAITSSFLAIFDPNYWLASDKNLYFAERMTRTTTQIKQGEAWKSWLELQAPAYETVILPLATAGSFKYITAVKAAVPATSLLGKAIPVWTAGMAGTTSTMIGANIGYTAAKTGGFTSKETLGTIGITALQLGVMGVGYKYTNPKLNAGQISVSTQSVGMRNPMNPTESLFISKSYTTFQDSLFKNIKIKGNEALSIIETKPINVGAREPTYITSGMRYSSDKNIFGSGIKEESIFGLTSGKYTGDINNFVSTISKGIAIGKNEAVFFKGASLSKTSYAGESIIKNGFLEQTKNTIDTATSIGTFKSKSNKGIFGDTTKAYTPELAGKDYFGSDMSAQGGLIAPSTKLDFILPGGISGVKLEYAPLSLLSPIHPQNQKASISLINPIHPQNQMKYIDDIAYSSSYWNNIKPKQNQNYNLGITNITSNNLLSNQIQNNIRNLTPTSIQKIMQTQSQKVEPIQIQDITQQQNQIQRQMQKQLQETTQLQEKVTVTTSKETTILKPITFALPEIPDALGEIPEIKTGFDVFVKGRRYYKGKKRKPESWIRITKQPLTKEQALSLGATVAEHSAAASFKIKPSGEPVGKPSIRTESWGNLSNKFYERKGALIERTAHRINTAGEVKGISALGWIATRQKLPTKIKYASAKTAKPIKPVTVNINKIVKGWNI